MSVLFDLVATQPLCGQTHGGAEYAKSLFRHLVASTPSVPITGFHDPSRPLDPEIREAATSGRISLTDLRSTADLESVARASGCDKLVSVLPYSMHDIDLSDLDVFFAVHGLRFIECPVDRNEWRYAQGGRDVLKWAIKTMFKSAYVGWRRQALGRVLDTRARRLKIIVPSQHTRFAILDTYPDFDESQIEILYCPETAVARHELKDLDIQKIQGLQTERFILIVSGGTWMKNAYRALEACVDVLESVAAAQGMKIALAGGAPVHIPRRWRRHIVELGRLSTEELAVCYANAFCLLYPTLNEGFGYPPLEAMARGTPVLCSAITSTTEILEDAALYFSPYSIPEMKNRLHMLLGDPALHHEYSRRGTARHAVVSEIQRRDLDAFRCLLTGTP